MDAMFDVVKISDGGRELSLTPDAFVALPVDVRIGHVLGGTVAFYKGGEPVDRRQALASLRVAFAKQGGR